MKTLALALLASAALAAPTLAQEAGTLTLGVGIGVVSPKDGNGTVAGGSTEIGSSTRPTLTLEYFLKDNLGIEVLAALPFKHDIAINGGHVGETKQLPPTISLNWHIPTGSKLTPFVGVGVNYTTFFEDRSPLGDLKISNSWGLAAHLGVDYALSEKSALRLDVRYIDINSDVYLDGAKIGEVEVDPVAAGLSYVMTF